VGSCLSAVRKLPDIYVEEKRPHHWNAFDYLLAFLIATDILGWMLLVLTWVNSA
jgi:hypothetical protein